LGSAKPKVKLEMGELVTFTTTAQNAGRPVALVG